MLGENDTMDEVERLSNTMFGNMGFGGMGGSFMNKMLSNTMRMLEKEMKNNSKGKNQNSLNNQNMNGFPKTKIRLMINGKEIDLNNNGMMMAENPEKKLKIKPATVKFKKFSEEQAKRFSKLQKKEPKTDLRRIADKITYEIEMPGVSSIEDV